LNLSMFLCQPVFNSVKSYGYQLWCVIFKKQNETSGFIAATLYFSPFEPMSELFTQVYTFLYK
jgi:hypothetical protein